MNTTFDINPFYHSYMDSVIRNLELILEARETIEHLAVDCEDWANQIYLPRGNKFVDLSFYTNNGLCANAQLYVLRSIPIDKSQSREYIAKTRHLFVKALMTSEMNLLDLLFAEYCMSKGRNIDFYWPVGRFEMGVPLYSAGHERWELAEYLYNNLKSIRELGYLSVLM